MMNDIYMGLFLVVVAWLFSGAWMIIEDKQKEWEERVEKKRNENQ